MGVGHCPQHSPSAPLSVLHESIAFSKCGPHRDHWIFESAVPIGAFSRNTAWHLTLIVAPLASPTAESSHVPQPTGSFPFSRRQLPMTRAVFTDDLELLHVPRAISRSDVPHTSLHCREVLWLR